MQEVDCCFTLLYHPVDRQLIDDWDFGMPRLDFVGDYHVSVCVNLIPPHFGSGLLSVACLWCGLTPFSPSFSLFSFIRFYKHTVRWIKKN